MKVFLTFDVEIWCDGWNDLDAQFPARFDRYVYGRSARGCYALPKTLEILERNGLHGVFFVEPLFAARFGVEHLQRIVQMIRSAGQEIQLHLHPEWTDEIRPAIIDNCTVKRQHLCYYTLDEQTALIAYGKKLLEDSGSGQLTAFRAGSYAANRDTFEALQRNGLLLDSSLNRCHAVSAPELRGANSWTTPFAVAGVTTIPVSTFRDGFGKERPAQVGACSYAELRDALSDSRALRREHFVIVSHNFEMLKPASSAPDRCVVRRFEQLCAFLGGQREHYATSGFSTLAVDAADTAHLAPALPRASPTATVRRHGEQIWRRLGG